MGKNFETKWAILRSLVVHRRTLTDLSRQLGLCPSTVKQHLEELRAMRMVQFVEDIHLSRFKYYETAPGILVDSHAATAVNAPGRRVLTAGLIHT
jgi:hypothetical protein